MNELDLTFKITPKDGSIQTAFQMVNEIIQDTPSAVDKLNIEVNEVYDSKPKVGNVNHGCNIQNNVIHM